MAESNLNRRLMKALKPFHPVRVENAACPGTPDINCTMGWIEDKFLARWPQEGIVKCEHFTPQQRVWAILRHRAGGRVFLMAKIAKDYVLLTGNVAAEIFGRVDEATLRSRALKVWSGQLDDGELRTILIHQNNAHVL